MVLVCFEQMSGMKINCDKSDLLTIGMDEDALILLQKSFVARKVSSQSNFWVYLFITQS